MNEIPPKGGFLIYTAPLALLSCALQSFLHILYLFHLPRYPYPLPVIPAKAGIQCL